jgi:small subunit ribosomal protein S14
MKNGIRTDKNRRELYKKYEIKRLICKAFLKNSKTPLKIKKQQSLLLSNLPKNSSKVRQKNFCVLTGRSKGVFKKFQISRISFRDLASKGLLAGVFKSSW